MWHINYYTEPNGRQPVAEWLNELDRKIIEKRNAIVELELKLTSKHAALEEKELMLV